jgi:hypothetical protein
MIRWISPAIVLLTLTAVPQAFADKLASVSLERMTHESDRVFVGHAEKQDLVKGGFVVIDVDGRQKSLDVAITTFSIDESLKGSNQTTAYVCSIVNPLKYADIEPGKTYILFLQQTGKYLQRTYGSMSQIEIDDGKVTAHYFNGTDKSLETPESIKAAVLHSAPQSKGRVHNTPYNPYAMAPYKIVKSACAGA